MSSSWQVIHPGEWLMALFTAFGRSYHFCTSFVNRDYACATFCPKCGFRQRTKARGTRYRKEKEVYRYWTNAEHQPKWPGITGSTSDANSMFLLAKSAKRTGSWDIDIPMSILWLHWSNKVNKATHEAEPWEGTHGGTFMLIITPCEKHQKEEKREVLEKCPKCQTNEKKEEKAWWNKSREQNTSAKH